MVQNYLDVQDLPVNSFDAVFYMESSLHCEDRAQTFKQAYKVLKPGGRVVAFEVRTRHVFVSITHGDSSLKLTRCGASTVRAR